MPPCGSCHDLSYTNSRHVSCAWTGTAACMLQAVRLIRAGAKLRVLRLVVDRTASKCVHVLMCTSSCVLECSADMYDNC